MNKFFLYYILGRLNGRTDVDQSDLIIACAYLIYNITVHYNIRQSLIFYSSATYNGNISTVSYDGCVMKFNTTLVPNGD